MCKFSHTYCITILFQEFVYWGMGSGTVGVAPRKKLNPSSQPWMADAENSLKRGEGGQDFYPSRSEKLNRLSRCAEIEHITQNDVDCWWKQTVRTFSKQQPFLAVVWWKYLGKEKQFRLPEIEGAGMMLNTVVYSTLLQIAVISAIMSSVKKTSEFVEVHGNNYYYRVITSSTSVR